MKSWMIGSVLCAASLVVAAMSPSQSGAQDLSDVERPEPGEYRATITLQSLDMPGAPPQMADMMSQMMSNTITYCLTEAEIEEGFRSMTDRSLQEDQECTYERFDYSGGKIDGVVVCRGDGRAMRMEMTGEGRATSSDFTMKMSGDFGMGDGTMTLRAQHERLGACS